MCQPTSYLVLGTLPACNHSHLCSSRERQQPTCTLYTDFETNTRRVFRPAGRTYDPRFTFVFSFRNTKVMENQVQNYQSCLTRKALGVRTQHMAKDGTVMEIWVCMIL